MEQDETAGFAPTTLVHAASGTVVVMGLITLVLMARLLLATRGSLSTLLAVGHGAVAIACFLAAAGARSGRLAGSIVGMLACPAAALGSAFALMTGSIGGVFGGVIALLALVLLLLSLGDVARMGQARRAMRAGAAGAMPMPFPSYDGPPSSDLPRLKPRRWPIVLALVVLVVLGGGGVAIGLRTMARDEHAKEVTAFQSLETCLLGGKPPADVPPSLAYRRMELAALGGAPVLTNPWPARCSTHAHALAEARRRAGATDKSKEDVAFFAERVGQVVGDARRVSEVYDAIDALWRQTAKDGYASLPNEAGAASPTWLDADALAAAAPLSRSRVSLAAFRTDRVPGTTLHLLADGVAGRGDGTLLFDGRIGRVAAVRAARPVTRSDSASPARRRRVRSDTAPVRRAEWRGGGLPYRRAARCRDVELRRHRSCETDWSRCSATIAARRSMPSSAHGRARRPRARRSRSRVSAPTVRWLSSRTTSCG